jgi:hypothetical protein
MGIALAASKDLVNLKLIARTHFYKDEDPLPYAIAALMVSTRSTKEIAGTHPLSGEEKEVIETLLVTALNLVSRRLLYLNPELTNEILQHPSIKSKLENGPLRRLSKEYLAVKSLRSLLTSSFYFFHFRKKNYKGFNDLRIKLSLAIYYSWIMVVKKKRGKLESVIRLQKEGRKLFDEIIRSNPEDPWATVLYHRYKLAWESDKRLKKAESLKAFKSTSYSNGAYQNTLRAFSLNSVYDYSQRINDKKLAKEALADLRNYFPPETIEGLKKKD